MLIPVVAADGVGVLVAEELVDVVDITSLTMFPGLKLIIELAVSHVPLLSVKPQHHVVAVPTGTMTIPPVGLTELPLDCYFIRLIY